jgi:hypothetical protein
MAEKDFSGINTGRIYRNIEQATAQKGQQGTASPQEAAERASQMKTQGRKGCKAVRINMAFSPENYEFIRVMSRISGQTLTDFTNNVIAKYREEHPEIFEQAKAIIEKM